MNPIDYIIVVIKDAPALSTTGKRICADVRVEIELLRLTWSQQTDSGFGEIRFAGFSKLARYECAQEKESQRYMVPPRKYSRSEQSASHGCERMIDGHCTIHRLCSDSRLEVSSDCDGSVIEASRIKPLAHGLFSQSRVEKNLL